MAGYFEKRRKRRAASDKRKETARAASLQAELNTLTGRTSPQGVAGQPASGDPNTWCSKLPEGTQVRLYRGQAFLSEISGDELRDTALAGEPIEALLLDLYGAGKYSLRPYIDGALRAGVRVLCGDVDSTGKPAGQGGRDVDAELARERDSSATRERLGGIEAKIDAMNSGGGGGPDIEGLVNAMAGLKQLSTDPVMSTLLEKSLERAFAPPVAVTAAPPASGDDNAGFFNMLSSLMTAVSQGAGGLLNTPAGAFAGQTAQDTAPADPPPTVVADGPPPAEADDDAAEPVELDDDGLPDDTPAHIARAVEQIADPASKLMSAKLLLGMERAAQSGRPDAVAGTALLMWQTAQLWDADNDLVQRFPHEPGDVFDEICEHIDIDDDVQEQARALVIPQMAEVAAEMEQAAEVIEVDAVDADAAEDAAA